MVGDGLIGETWGLGAWIVAGKQIMNGTLLNVSHGACEKRIMRRAACGRGSLVESR